MTYDESIQYLEHLAVFGSKPGFERINGLLDRLDHPERGLSCIHVAGTNGKGSVCTETAGILTAAGYRTGLFTSPYVSDFRERIQLNGQYIEKEVLARITTRVAPIAAQLAASGIQPTEFEVITAIAFLFFREAGCQVVVLEVGLGGLLDSTNVIRNPLVCAITSLSYDHMAVLGNTMEEIAAQKAGILKDGAPAVTAGNQPEEALGVLRRTASLHGCSLTVADPDAVCVTDQSIFGFHFLWEGQEMFLPLAGPHQVINLAVSLQIVTALRAEGFIISTDDIRKGLAHTVIPARIEVLSQKPLVILDGGHNEDGVRVLTETLREYTDGRPHTFVIGIMADKSVPDVLRLLCPLAARVVTTQPGNPRAMEAGALRRACVDAGMADDIVTAVPEPAAAFDEALRTLPADGCLVVCGSLYLAGDVRARMRDVLDKRNGRPRA